MAEIWPKLRNLKLLLVCNDAKQKKSKRSSSKSGIRSKSSKAANPYASIGLEKFATLLDELQSKQQQASSLVERTASSLSAARCISRSAQEWTASTLVRTASRRSSVDTAPKLSHSAQPTDNSTTISSVVLTPSPVGKLLRESENLSEDGQPQGCQSEEVSTSSNSAPLGVHLPVMTTRSCCSVKKSTRRWSQTSKSAFVVLVALGEFISIRVGKVGKPLAAILTLSAIIRIWYTGKASTQFMFSSIAVYLLTPLRSYFITHIPRPRLISLPHNPESQNTESEVAQPELRDSSLELQSAIPVTIQEEPDFSILLQIPESTTAAPSNSKTVPSPQNVAVMRPSRRLAKKISSRISSGLKKLKMFKSSSSSSVNSFSSICESSSHPTPSSDPSSHRLMWSFSRHKTGDITEAPSFESTSTSSSHQSFCNGRKIMQRQKSSESVSCSKKSRVIGRLLSSETLEQYYNLSDSIASPHCESKHSSTSSWSRSVDHEAPVAWPMVGLLVTLLFLVVGRVPAILATSLFFVVVSPHSRARGRENRAWESAARKLHGRSSPPRGGRWAGSSPRSSS